MKYARCVAAVSKETVQSEHHQYWLKVAEGSYDVQRFANISPEN